MKKYPSWRVPDTYIDINYVVLFRTLGPACEHPWEEHALKTVWLYKGKCAFCFVLLCSLQGKITDKKEAAGDRGKSEEEKAKKSLWKATQQSSFDHLTISQLKGWPGNNPPQKRCDNSCTGSWPPGRYTSDLSYWAASAYSHKAASAHLYTLTGSECQPGKSLEWESCLHRCLDQAQHNEALILLDLGELRAQTTLQYFHCVRLSDLGLPAHLFW